MRIYSLKPHPDFPAASTSTIRVYGDSDGHSVVLSYVLRGDPPAIPPPAAPLRTDDLWRTTCFELFLQNSDGGYVEFNFSPSTQWAAYAFTRYREGRSDLAMAVAPIIAPIENGIRVSADLSALSGASWRAGITAVIEAKDGTKSYWALAHAPGPPDFHNADCFIAHLPASDRA
jgi:hypothetical protein